MGSLGAIGGHVFQSQYVMRVESTSPGPGIFKRDQDGYRDESYGHSLRKDQCILRRLGIARRSFLASVPTSITRGGVLTNRSSKLNPDSAAVIDRKREAQPFRSEVDGFLPLGRHRSAVLRGNVKPHRNDVRERKMPLKLHRRTPSLLQDSTSLPASSV
jgi:hypothetical protein